MALSESQREAASTSPDRSGDPYYGAAKVRFAPIHEMLTAIGEGKALPRSLRGKVWEELELAREAAFGSVSAKLAQIEVADGRPLTFCFGKQKRRRITALRRLDDAAIEWGLFGDGCGRVFADSVTDSRPVFACYCPVCREFSEDRRSEEIRTRCAGAWDGRFAVPGGWRLACRGCGERFFATTPQRRRCDRCRH